MTLTSEGEDKLREKPVITPYREWLHDDKNGCNKQDEPQRATPGLPPQKCDGVVGAAPYVSGTPCGSESWRAGDRVWTTQDGNVARRKGVSDEVTPPVSPPPSQVSGNEDDRMRFWLALVLISMVSLFLAATFFLAPKLPGDTEGLIIGGMLTWMGVLLNYYWGSSSGSKIKTMQQKENDNSNGGK